MVIGNADLVEPQLRITVPEYLGTLLRNLHFPLALQVAPVFGAEKFETSGPRPSPVGGAQRSRTLSAACASLGPKALNPAGAGRQISCVAHTAGTTASRLRARNERPARMRATPFLGAAPSAALVTVGVCEFPAAPSLESSAAGLQPQCYRPAPASRGPRLPRGGWRAAESRGRSCGRQSPSQLRLGAGARIKMAKWG